MEHRSDKLTNLTLTKQIEDVCVADTQTTTIRSRVPSDMIGSNPCRKPLALNTSNHSRSVAEAIVIRDVVCDTNGGLLYFSCTENYIKTPKVLNSNYQHQETQTDDEARSASILNNSNSILARIKSIVKPTNIILEDFANGYDFVNRIQSQQFSHADPQLLPWIKGYGLPSSSLSICVAMQDKLDECLVKKYLYKKGLKLSSCYAKSINLVTKVYIIEGNVVMVVTEQSKTDCSDLIYAVQTIQESLHQRVDDTFTITLDCNCMVNKLITGLEYITHCQGRNIKWILSIPFNSSLNYERALSSRWITGDTTKYVKSKFNNEYLTTPAFDYNSDDNYFKNSLVEIMFFMKNVNCLISDYLAQQYSRFSGTLPFSATSLSEINVFVYDNYKKTYIQLPVSNHRWGFDGRSLVEFDTEKDCFITSERYIFCSTATEMMLDQPIHDRLIKLSLPYDRIKPEIVSIQGVPGCGKSTWILKSHKIGSDLVLSSTKHGINDIKTKIASQCVNTGLNYEDIKTNYRTIASYLLNGIKKYNTVFIDEYLMVHAGLLSLVALLSDCKKMFILGDQNQIPYIDRLKFVNMRFFDANKFATTTKYLNSTYRCPADVVFALKKIYPGIVTTNTLSESVSFVVNSSISNIPVWSNTLYLTFSRADKRHLTAKLGLPESSKILTIHEAQGLTSENVICVRLTEKKIQLFVSLPHAIVALTRHTKRFIYFSPIEGDQLHCLICVALNARYLNLQGMLSNTLDVNQINGISSSGNTSTIIQRHEILAKTHDDNRVNSINYSSNTLKTNLRINDTFYFQNVNRMSSKASQFYNFVLKTSFPVYIICETSFNEGILSSEFFPSDYVIHRCDRSPHTSSKKSGGGVLIAVNAKIPNALHDVSIQGIEQLCVKLSISNKTIYVYVAYIPPDSPISSYTACCDTIVQIYNCAGPSDLVLITGDFNLPNITWAKDDEIFEILPLNVSSDNECLFIDTVFDLNLAQICGVKNERHRILDLIFTNEPEIFTVNESSLPFVANDINHKSLEIILKRDAEFNTNSHRNRKLYYNFGKADSTNLRLYLEKINWLDELNSNLLDVNVERFYKILSNGIELYVPVALAKNDKYPPWYDNKLINLKNKRDKAYKESLKHHTVLNKHNFLKCNEEFENVFEIRYKEYISSIKDKIKHDPKHFWTYFKTKRESHGYPACMTFNGRKTCDTQDISNWFAEFFQSVYKAEDISQHKSIKFEESDLSIHIPHININDIFLALQTIGDGCGPDGIPISLLKDYKILAFPLCLLFNQSLNLAEFPQKWKITRIIPLFKNGARNDVSCYRGITSISSIPKLFELVVCNSFKTLVSRHISQYQHGFMPHRSTSTNLIEFTSDCIGAIENHLQVDVVYTDFAKAFDSISHSITLQTLSRFGFTHQFVAWFKSYLTNRKQYIELGDKKSKWIHATSGVPQGSHVGPWIFLIFINGITKVIKHSKILMFADDLKIYKILETMDDSLKLQEDIDNLSSWCESYSLHLNTNKCRTISFHRKASPVIQHYQINGILLDRVSEIKDLGVTFVVNMTFSKHIQQCVARANCMLGFIKRWTVDIYDLDTIKILYYAYVRSQVEYAVMVWCPFYDEYIQSIEKIQKKFLRYIIWKDGWTYNQELPYHLNLLQLPSYAIGCKTYNITTLQNRRELLKCAFLGNILLNEIDAPSILASIKINAPSRSLRDHEFLQLIKHRTNYGDNEPINSMSKSFNTIAHLFDFHLSKDNFKRALKHHFAPK